MKIQFNGFFIMRINIDCRKIDSASATAVLKAVSNEKRLQILCNLLDRELCVNELEKEIGLSQSALSQHLAKLRASNLVVTRRDAQTIYYTAQNSTVREIIICLQKIFPRKNQ